MNDSRLESEVFLQTLQMSYWQTQRVFTQKMSFLLHWSIIIIGQLSLLWLCLLVVLC